MNVLVVSGGSFQGLAILKGLLASPRVRIVLADCFRETIGSYFAHRSYVVPEVANESQFINSLLRICVDEAIDLIIPSTDIELACLARHETRFSQLDVHLAVSNSSFLAITRNKRTLYTFLMTNGLPVLPTVVNLNRNSVFPIIGKPLYGWGGKGMIILRSKEELATYNLLVLEEGYTWQPYLVSAREYSVDFALGLDTRVSTICARERIRTVSGMAVISRSASDADVLEVATKFARCACANGGRGIFNIQMLRQGKELFVTDVNPRIGTSAVSAYALGINLPLFLCSSIRRDVSACACEVTQKRSVTTVRYLEELTIEESRLNADGIVLDLDDTLISQKHWILAKLQAVLRLYSNVLPSGRTFLGRAMQLVEEGTRAHLFDALCDEFQVSAEMKAELIDAYRSARPEKAHVFTDVCPVLEELRGRGVKLAIVTDNPVVSQRQKIAVSGLGEYVDVVVYSREVGGEKPQKRIFAEVATQLGIPPEKLVMVGDNLYRDIAGALEAGYLHTFLVRRAGVFLNSNAEVFREVFPEYIHCTQITGLFPLLRFIGEAHGPLVVDATAELHDPM